MLHRREASCLAARRCMIRIDTHQHFWTYDPEKYAWMGASMRPIQRNFMPEDLAPELAGSGVGGTVLVEARGHIEETENLLSIARRTDFVRGVVGWLPLTEPRLEALLEHYAAAAKLKGIRHWLGPDTDLESMFSKAIQRGVALLGRAQLSFDLMLWPPQLAVAPRFVDRHPDQVFVLDHFAKPYIRAGELEPWRTQIRELSRRPNVYC